MLTNLVIGVGFDSLSRANRSTDASTIVQVEVDLPISCELNLQRKKLTQVVVSARLRGEPPFRRRLKSSAEDVKAPTGLDSETGAAPGIGAKSAIAGEAMPPPRNTDRL